MGTITDQDIEEIMMNTQCTNSSLRISQRTGTSEIVQEIQRTRRGQKSKNKYSIC